MALRIQRFPASPKCYVLFLLLLLTAGGLGQKALPAQNLPLLNLSPLLINRGSLDLEAYESWQDFALNIDDLCYGIRLEILGAEADLDIRLLDADYQEVSRAESSEFNETFYISRTTDPPLRSGRYVLRVGYFLDNPPLERGKVVKSLNYQLKYRQIRVDSPRPLALDKAERDVLEPENGMLRVYRLNLKPGQKKLRIDTFDSQADLDLFIFVDPLQADPLKANWMARSYRAQEYLVLDLDYLAGLDPQWNRLDLYVMVLSSLDEVPAGFSLKASSQAAVPEELDYLPKPSELVLKDKSAVSPALEKAISATVEILGQSGGGSGCVVSPQGLILTNYHVVSGPDGRLEKDLAIGFSTDPRKSPESLFLARVIEANKEKDLALLQIYQGYYGQKLAPGYVFPWIEIADSSKLQLGQELLFAGYPVLGGLGSRATITLTKGIVSGFEDRAIGTLLKTDALISPGNSGGAALDSQARLVGIPTLVISDASSQMTYVYPTEIIPREWFSLFGSSAN